MSISLDVKTAGVNVTPIDGDEPLRNKEIMMNDDLLDSQEPVAEIDELDVEKWVVSKDKINTILSMKIQFKIFSVPLHINKLIQVVEFTTRLYLTKLLCYLVILCEPRYKDSASRQIIMGDGYDPNFNSLPPSIVLGIAALIGFYIQKWYEFNKFQIKYYIIKLYECTQSQTYALTHYETHLILDFFFLFIIGIVVKRQIEIEYEVFYWCVMGAKYVILSLGQLPITEENKLIKLFLYQPTINHLIDIEIFLALFDLYGNDYWRTMIMCWVVIISCLISGFLIIGLRAMVLPQLIMKSFSNPLTKCIESYICKMTDYEKEDFKAIDNRIILYILEKL